MFYLDLWVDLEHYTFRLVLDDYPPNFRCFNVTF